MANWKLEERMGGRGEIVQRGSESGTRSSGEGENRSFSRGMLREEFTWRV